MWKEIIKTNYIIRAGILCLFMEKSNWGRAGWHTPISI